MADSSSPRAGRPRSVTERVATTLRTAIVEGLFRPGDALPSERELADEYDVNRSSVREAMKRLEAWGLVTIRHGEVTRVSDFFLSAGLDLLPHLVEAGAKVDPAILRDLHEIRELLLGWCASKVAERADPASVARLEALARRLADARTRPAELQDLDYDFLEEMVRITGNRLLGLFTNVVRQVYQQRRERFLALYQPGVFDPRHHRDAVEAIRRRDSAAAGEAMRAHARTALKTVPQAGLRP